MDEERLLGEAALRRALRLEAEERPPRLDVAALRAAAELAATAPRVSLVAGTAFGLLGLAAAVAALRVASDLAALVLSGAALDLVIAVLAVLAPPLEAAWGVVAQPSTPLAILVAAAIAILSERRMEESRA